MTTGTTTKEQELKSRADGARVRLRLLEATSRNNQADEVVRAALLEAEREHEAARHAVTVHEAIKGRDRAERLSEDSALLKQCVQALAKLDSDEKERRKAFDLERKQRVRERDTLRARVADGGEAMRRLELAVPVELRDALSRALSDERALAQELRDARAELSGRTAALGRASAEVTDAATRKHTLPPFQARVEDAEFKVATLEERMEEAQARTAAARAARDEALAQLMGGA